jgi:coenzyme F420 biosynthesis associated uncharacterized protein
MTQIVDWDLAASTAGALGRTGPSVTYTEASEVVTSLRELTDLAEEHVVKYTGLRAQVEHPPVRVVDRKDWAAVNVAGLRQVVTPVAERLGVGKAGPLMRTAGAKTTGVQAGAVLAYLSGKVLGQYEVFSSDPGQLLLVAPNVVDAERKLEVDSRDFRLWVCLHEVTHRTQFTAVPWLRGHFLAEVLAFAEAAELDPEALAERLRRAVSTIADVIGNPRSRGSVIDLVQTPAQREVLDRLTALMTLAEGHAEFVMDGVGPEVVPSVAVIRERFDARRAAGSPVQKIVRKLLGIEAKLRQYAEGNKFVAAVVDQIGMDGFNQIWTSAETLPTLAELTEPNDWIERVHGRAAPGGS